MLDNVIKWYSVNLPSKFQHWIQVRSNVWARIIVFGEESMCKSRFDYSIRCRVPVVSSRERRWSATAPKTRRVKTPWNRSWTSSKIFKTVTYLQETYWYSETLGLQVLSTEFMVLFVSSKAFDWRSDRRCAKPDLQVVKSMEIHQETTSILFATSKVDWKALSSGSLTNIVCSQVQVPLKVRFGAARTKRVETRWKRWRMSPNSKYSNFEPKSWR